VRVNILFLKGHPKFFNDLHNESKELYVQDENSLFIPFKNYAGGMNMDKHELSRFDLLVTEQLETMDKLLNLQSEIERYQQIEAGLLHEKDERLHSVQKEINRMKLELEMIQKLFEQQTEEVIKTYQSSI
jgi:hypothetical protein